MSNLPQSKLPVLNEDGTFQLPWYRFLQQITNFNIDSEVISLLSTILIGSGSVTITPVASTFVFTASGGGGSGISGPISSINGELPAFLGTMGNAVTNTGCVPSANGYSLISAANYVAMRTALGLGTASTHAATDFLLVANNLSDIASVSTARTNLGLGSAALLASSAVAQTANNLSDLVSASTARTNLGLGTIATQSTITASQISDPTNVKSIESLEVACSDETTVLTTGTSKVTFWIPYNFTGTQVFIANSIQSSSGIVTANLKQNGTTVFSTNPSIGASQNTSLSGSGSVAAVLSVTSYAQGDKMTVDITTAGTGAAGLKLILIGHRT